LDDGLAWLLFSTHGTTLLLHTAFLANINVVSEVGVDGILEVLNGGPVVQRDDISIVDEDIQVVRL
jgi:hypothetical protein